jgi:RNA polymerase sigma factor (sigma-70 family)
MSPQAAELTESLPNRSLAIPITQEEFADAYRRYFLLTIRFLHSRGIKDDMGLDIAQAAWARGWERRNQLREHSMLVTWINSIALNSFRTLLRRKGETIPLPDLCEPLTNPGTAIDANSILNECPPKDRRLLEDFYIQGYSITEIAKRYHCSEVSLRIRLMRARRRVQHSAQRAQRTTARNRERFLTRSESVES